MLMWSNSRSLLLLTDIFMKRTIELLTMLLAASALSAGAATPDSGSAASDSATKPAVKTSDLFPDTVVAKGKGVEVKRSQLDDEVIRVKAQLLANRQPVPPDRVNKLEQQILDQLIQLQLIKAKATDAEISGAKKQADKQLDEAKTQLGSDESLNMQLKAKGITREELLSKWT